MKSYLLFLLLFLGSLVTGQNVPYTLQQKAREEILRRDINEQEFRNRLAQRGINIDSVTAEEMPQLQHTIEAIINDLEREKTASAKMIDKETVKDSLYSRRSVPATVDSLPNRKLDDLAAKETKSPPAIYGQGIFRNKALEIFQKTRDVKPPPSYRLGPGDEIAVTIFGTSQADLVFEIAEDGFIRPTNMPRVLLKGVRYDDARELLSRRFREAYLFRPEQFVMRLNTARTIHLHIFGEVFQQGSFTLSALNSAFNALVAAGGPSDIGSVRKIKLIRNGEERILDVYQFLVDPAIQYDYALENNDIIFVPAAERIVNLRGAVNRPSRYELAEGEDLQELIAFAGGLTPNAYTELIQIRRYENNRQRLIDVPLSQLLQDSSDFSLHNGDEILIKTILDDFENNVLIEGAVRYPGQYALESDMRVSGLLRKGILQPEAKTDLAFLFRRNLDKSLKLIPLNLDQILQNPGTRQDPLLSRSDRVLVYQRERYVDDYNVQVSGAIRNPGQYEYDFNLKVRDLIYLAGGLTEAATDFAYLIRSEPGNPEQVTYQRIDVNRAVNDTNSIDNLLLRPLDRLRILNKSTFTDRADIQVKGAVRSPINLPYTQTLTLKDAITLAGGLKLEAASNRIDIFRLQIDQNQPTRTLNLTINVTKDFHLLPDTAQNFALQPFDQVIVRAVPEFEFQKIVQVQGEVKYPGPYTIEQDNERISDLIRKAGGLTPEAFSAGGTLFRAENETGNVIVDVDRALTNPGSREDLILQEGDSITIPKSRRLITIHTQGTKASELYTGEQLDEDRINITFDGRKSARWYIKQYAAGFSNNAQRTGTVVALPNGRIERTKRFLFFKNYPQVAPGSQITVALRPPKPERPVKEKSPVNWETVVRNTVALATSALTLIILAQRVE